MATISLDDSCYGCIVWMMLLWLQLIWMMLLWLKLVWMILAMAA